MQKTLIAGLLAGSAVLGGCTQFAEAPQPQQFPLAKQQHVQAASHWQLVATDTARQLMAALPEKYPLHVQRKATESPFEKAFADQLLAELTRAGYPVMKSMDRPGTLQVDLSTQAVRFSAERRYQESFIGAKTTGAAMLAGGLLAVYKLSDNIFHSVSKTGAGLTAVVGVAAVGEAFDWYAEKTGSQFVPSTELLVGVTVSSEDRYYASTNSAYYTSETDWWLYANNAVLPLKGGN